MKKGDCFGVDVSGDVSSFDVREAIVNCFLDAHKNVLEGERKDVFGDKEGLTEKIEVEGLIREMFEENGGDFDNPTKESLEAVVEALKVYASKFRSQKEIEKHARIIMNLIKRIRD